MYIYFKTYKNIQEIPNPNNVNCSPLKYILISLGKEPPSLESFVIVKGINCMKQFYQIWSETAPNHLSLWYWKETIDTSNFKNQLTG